MKPKQNNGVDAARKTRSSMIVISKETSTTMLSAKKRATSPVIIAKQPDSRKLREARVLRGKQVN